MQDLSFYMGLNVLIGLLTLIAIGVFIYQIKQMNLHLPTRIRLSAAGYQKGVKSKQRKVEKAFYRDVANLMINRNPQLFEDFPLTMDQISQNPELAVPTATLIARHAAPLVVDTVMNKLGIESETAKAFTSEVAGNTNLISSVINAVWPKNKGLENQKKKEKVEKDKNKQKSRYVM